MTSNLSLRAETRNTLDLVSGQFVIISDKISPSLFEPNSWHYWAIITGWEEVRSLRVRVWQRSRVTPALHNSSPKMKPTTTTTTTTIQPCVPPMITSYKGGELGAESDALDLLTQHNSGVSPGMFHLCSEGLWSPLLISLYICIACNLSQCQNCSKNKQNCNHRGISPPVD